MEEDRPAQLRPTQPVPVHSAVLVFPQSFLLAERETTTRVPEAGESRDETIILRRDQNFKRTPYNVL